MNYDPFIKICQMLFSVTKLDIRLFDDEENNVFQLANYSIPSIIELTTKKDVQINQFLYQNSINTFYHYVNNFGLEYIAASIWHKQAFLGSIHIGPFISNISAINFTKDLIVRSNIPISERKHLEQFYQSLPVLSETEYQHIGEMLVNLCHHTLISPRNVKINSQESIQNKSHLQPSIKEDTDIIEERYEEQTKLMVAIAKGDKREANNIIKSKTFIFDFSDRVPGSPIRASKNMTIVTNTLYRVAAESGGVHPIYLHSISERFAILIERATTLPQLQKLNMMMVNEYCDLVKNFSTSFYSPIVKKAKTTSLLEQILAHYRPNHES